MIGEEWALQPITEEQLSQTTNQEDGMHLNIAAENFWGNNNQHAFFYFNPIALSYYTPYILSYKDSIGY